MRKLGIVWLLHFIATVAGWYALSAIAQGVVDSHASATLPLVIFNAIIQILCFPIVTLALWRWPGVGGFELDSFLAFAALAAVNSAVIVAAATAAVRAASGRSGRPR